MAVYSPDHTFSEDEHLHYDEEIQLFSDIEDKLEQAKGRLQKSRDRKTRLLLENYLERKRYHDLYDPDLGDKGTFDLW